MMGDSASWQDLIDYIVLVPIRFKINTDTISEEVLKAQFKNIPVKDCYGLIDLFGKVRANVASWSERECEQVKIGKITTTSDRSTKEHLKITFRGTYLTSYARWELEYRMEIANEIID